MNNYIRNSIIFLTLFLLQIILYYLIREYDYTTIKCVREQYL